MMRGYDQYNTLLLPPRGPGDKLPPELLDFMENEKKRAALNSMKSPGLAESQDDMIQTSQFN